MQRRTYLTPAFGNDGDSTLSKRNALLSGYTPSNSSANPYGQDDAYGQRGFSRTPSPSQMYGGSLSRPDSSASRGSAYASQRQAEDLEGQNDEEMEGLSAKVKMLKDITISIGNEVRDSTKMLNGMNDTFDTTQGFLAGTFKRMNVMAAKQGGRWWYWMLFLIFVFWIFVFRWLGFI